LKGKARRQAAGLALQDAMVDAAVETAAINRTLFAALADAKATRDTGKPAVADALGTGLSYRNLIVAARVLAGKLEPLAPAGASVGIMLPNLASAAVAFFALSSIGRVPAMINFTSGTLHITACCRAARVFLILTSRAFIERGRFRGLIDQLQQSSVRIVYLEDVHGSIGFAD